MTTVSVAPDRYYSCTRKLYWGSEFLARNWATLLNFAYPDEPTPLQHYPCRHCDGFHVGHRP